MIQIAMNTKGSVDQNTLLSINNSRTQGIKNAQNIESINTAHGNGTMPRPAQARTPVSVPHGTASSTGMPTAPPLTASSAGTSVSAPPIQTTNAPAPVPKSVPPLRNPVQKGQKAALASGRPLNAVHACFGWNTSNPQCDVDVSAFLLDAEGKVLGDSWFVFYGQTSSPDQSVIFRMDDTEDREIMDIRFQKLNPAVKKIVFVLTINDAFEKNLNFGMMKDAYIRILDAGDRTELVSFQMTDYYTNVISMMIGEIYLHNNTWKFNAIGNGVARDLAGLCTLYGVEVSN